MLRTGLAQRVGSTGSSCEESSLRKGVIPLSAPSFGVWLWLEQHRSKEGGVALKTIGIVGGLSWPSTLQYYKILSEEIARLSNGDHTGRIQIDSWDFPPADQLMHKADWISLAEQLAESVRRLAASGSDTIALACNSLHRCIPSLDIEMRSRIVHILDPMCDEILHRGLRSPLLISTKFTADSKFYLDYVKAKTGVELTPLSGAALQRSHEIIFNELINGTITQASAASLREEISSSISSYTDAIILGCTELCLGVSPTDFSVPVLDTTELHARRLALIALEGDN